MSRLIDADELIEYVKIWEIGTSISSDQKEFIDCINNQPTAFDVNEVVERLKKVKDYVVIIIDFLSPSWGISLAISNEIWGARYGVRYLLSASRHNR